ncbi:hypothetical protein ACH5WX_08010 [Nocardioides sp. CER28]
MRHALLLLVPVMVTAGCTGSSDDRPAAGASANLMVFGIGGSTTSRS